MKNEKKKRKTTVRFRKGLIAYLVTVAGCVIFTQALISDVSNFVLRFVLLIPAADAAVLLVSCLSVTVAAEKAKMTVHKNRSESVGITVKNRGIAPVVSLKLRVTAPDANNVKCETRWERASVTPFSKSVYKTCIRFRYRGIYEVGTDGLEIDDLFGLFSARIEVAAKTEITVLPDLYSPLGEAFSDRNTESRADVLPTLSDGEEYGGVREYQPGDSIKNVHWKLSTKSEELLTRQTVTDTAKNTVIFCRLSDDSPEICDAVASETYSAVYEAALNGHHGTLKYGKGGKIISYDFSSVHGALDAGVRLSSAERTDASDTLAECGTALTVVAAYRPRESEKTLRALRGGNGTRASLLLIDISGTLGKKDREEYERKLSDFRITASRLGIRTAVSRSRKVLLLDNGEGGK